MSALVGLPADEATDHWAEEADSDDEAPRGRGDEAPGEREDEGGEGLLDAALDAAAALAAWRPSDPSAVASPAALETRAREARGGARRAERALSQTPSFLFASPLCPSAFLIE